MSYKYTITKKYILDTAKRLSDEGVKVHKGLRNLDVNELKYQFSTLVSFVKEDWREQFGEDVKTDENGEVILPDEQYELIRNSFAEELVKAENLKPNSFDDWLNIFDKVSDTYDAHVAKIKYEQEIKKSSVNIKNSEIYFDIVNSIASKSARLNNDQSRFRQIKYNYVSDGTGDLDESKFRDLVDDDDYIALSKLSEVYKDRSGFTSDPLYQEIKERAVNKGLDLVGNLTINTVPTVPSGPTFNFDF